MKTGEQNLFDQGGWKEARRGKVAGARSYRVFVSCGEEFGFYSKFVNLLLIEPG